MPQWARLITCTLFAVLHPMEGVAGPPCPNTAVRGLQLTLQAVAPSLLVRAAANVVPDSIRVRVLTLLAEGNVTGAVEYYLAATGSRHAPRWLQGIQAAFSTANRVAGRCADVATKLHEGFKALGKEPQYVKLRSTGSEMLAFELQAGVSTSTVQISNNNYHVAVRVGARIYDAYTGPKGLTEHDYLSRLFTPLGKIILEEVSSP